MYGMAYVIIAVAFGLAGGFVGRMKGSSFWMWFLVSFCVPFLGLACAVLYRWDDRELRRECPRCAKVVQAVRRRLCALRGGAGDPGRRDRTRSRDARRRATSSPERVRPRPLLDTLDFSF